RRSSARARRSAIARTWGRSQPRHARRACRCCSCCRSRTSAGRRGCRSTPRGLAKRRNSQAPSARPRRCARPASASRRSRSAIALWPAYAAAHFQRGLLLAELGRTEDARAAFRAAIDRDGVTHRLTTPLEDAFLGVMQRVHAPWVDLRETLQSDPSDAVARQL